jgi:uncharacterized protein
MDVTPLIPTGRKVIDAYGGGGFRISGESFAGSILLFPDRVLPWPVVDFAQVTRDSLAAFVGHAPAVELLLLGCGSRTGLFDPALRRELRAAGLIVEAMDTGAACRTYNVLLSEERRVAAALIAVG